MDAMGVVVPKIKQEPWMLTMTQQGLVSKRINMIKRLADRLKETCHYNTVLRSHDYDNLFKAVEELYDIARIADCTKHNQERHEKERKRVKELYG